MQKKRLQKDEQLLHILKENLAPALGCTEPIAVAYSAARASQEAEGNLINIQVKVNRNIYKNGLKVGIPGTDKRGLYIAAALGYLDGDPTRNYEVIEDISQNQIEKAQELVAKGLVNVDIAEEMERLYIETILTTEDRKIRVITLDHHLNVVDVESVIEGSLSPLNYGNEVEDKSPDLIQKFSLNEILDFVNNVDLDQLDILKEGIELSREIASEGLKQKPTLASGLKQMIESNLCKDNLINRSQMLCAAASEARMTGSKQAVMSNSGSGNQGITAFLTVIGAADVMEVKQEKLYRALALSNLLTIYIKSHLGVLSAMCGAGIAAGTGASAGVVYLHDGDQEEIIKTTCNMLGVISGMICDGAKEGCAYKVALSAEWAVRSALLAMEGITIDSSNGILADNFRELIESIGQINKPGMTETDKEILKVMLQ